MTDTADFLKGYQAGVADYEAGRLVGSRPPEPTEAMVEAMAAYDGDDCFTGDDLSPGPTARREHYRDYARVAFAAAPPEWLLRAALSDVEIQKLGYALNRDSELYKKLSRALRGGEET